MNIEIWVAGLLLSALGGYWIVSVFINQLRKYMRLPRKESSKNEKGHQKEKGFRGVPAGLTGVIERIFFTVLVAFNVSGIGAAMIAWIVLKLATNWNGNYWKEHSLARLYGFSALLAGLVSMLIAFLCGELIKANR